MHNSSDPNRFDWTRRSATLPIVGAIYIKQLVHFEFLVAGMRQFNPAIERVSVQSLKPYPRNARRHSKAQVKQVAASIERFGFSNPVLIADDGEIVAGHGRVAAAKLLGIETVPAVRLSHLSEAERRAYVIADNKLALNAGWDRELLAIELQGLVDLDFEIELTGFSLAEVDIVLDEARESASDSVDASIEDTIPPYRHKGAAVTQPAPFGCSGGTNSFAVMHAKQAPMRRFSAMKPST